MSKKWTEDELNYIREFYPDNGPEFCANYLINRKPHSVEDMASKIGVRVNKRIVSENLRSAQIKYQKNRPNDDFNVNIEQFLDVQTKEVAYILGYWWADAYILLKRGEIRFEIAADDMNTIKQVMDSLGKWVYSSRKRKENTVTVTTAVTSNRKLCQLLEKYDYCDKSRVSADKIISKIPLELRHYFFRGLVDGDGCIYVN